jgi:predicted Rossmann-fold nucleotide-binding protein
MSIDLRPSIVHFCGHAAGKKGIAFEDESGRSRVVSAEALAGFFELFADRLQCVVLNACYSENQAEAIAQHIDYVIGMKGDIGDTAAIEFAVAFYDALGAGESVEFAYRLAGNAIQWAAIPGHLAPILKPNTRSAQRANGSGQYSDKATIRSLNIMVTGGRETTHEVLKLAHLIGQQVILRGHTIMSNGSIGVDKASSEGALTACHLKNLDPSTRIQVFRPRKAPTPHFHFGKLQIVGRDYTERRDVVIKASDAVILLGAGKGSESVARQAQIMRKPIVPVGIGKDEEAAARLWHRMQGEYVDGLPIIRIEADDLHKIGPGQQDLEEVSLSAVLIAEKLVLSQAKS